MPPADRLILDRPHRDLIVETLPTQGKSATALFERLGWKEQSVLFEGMRGGWFDGRFSLMAGTPFAKFESKEETSRFELLGDGKGYAHHQKGNPLAHLQRWLDRFQSSLFEGSLSEIPFLQGGAAGFFSYDLVRRWENIPAPSVRNPAIPDILLLFFNLFVLLDHTRERLYLVYNPFPEMEMGKPEESACRDGRAKMAHLRSEFLSSRPSRAIKPQILTPTVEEDFSEREYVEMVLRAKEYIAAGDIFQTNLSHRFRIASPAPSPFQIYRRLRKINPSPFAAYLDLGLIQIASGSPERLVRVSTSGGRRLVSTRPIAGTHPRGGDEAEDQRMIQSLYKSEKERAEHLMLVDLERNDLGKVCRYGSIEVDELMSLEKYSHVLHLVSNIQGELRPEMTLTEVVQALFPGGTITGVPKVRCMEILSELEKRARGIYTGAVGYIDFTGEMDLNIAIRTWVRQGEEMTFQVGAGIVADSDPEKEYRETLQKAAALIKALEP
ncbi:anthranilate synthase component I family protein [Candidatus Manganitrophus noduliformans]|nr:anthranilate synthase component I family protein [Candidatus Manganitrophus noduliformans]